MDLDGVLWAGSRVFPRAIEAANALFEEGVEVVFVTNNSTASRAAYAERLRAAGIRWADESSVVNSAYATARFLAGERGPLRVFPIGEEGLSEELSLAGHRLAGEEDCWEGEVDAVVVGMDRGLTYDKLAAGLAALLRGADFVATNRDRTFPTERGEMPGAGAMVAALAEAAGKGPSVTVGKPNPAILRMAAGPRDPAEVLVVGDRLETDVAGARAAGMAPALVLTGVTGEDEIPAGGPERPDFVLDGLWDLLEGL